MTEPLADIDDPDPEALLPDNADADALPPPDNADADALPLDEPEPALAWSSDGTVPGTATAMDPEPGSPGHPEPGVLARRLPALRAAGYRRFLAGVFVSNIGSWMQTTAIGWLVLQLTNSPGLLGLATAAGTFPTLFLSVFAGVLADRVDRRRVLVATSLASAVVAGALAALVLTEHIAYWQILLLAVVAGTAQALATPASQALVSSLVGRDAVGNAVALNAAQFNLSRIVGPALAGAVIAAGGLWLAIGANMVSYLALALVLATLPTVHPATIVRAEAGLWSNLLDGIRYTRHSGPVAVLVALAAVPALFLLNYLVLLPVYARDVLDIGAAGLGLLTAGVGVGALVGAVLVAVLRPSGGSGRLLLLGLAGASAALVVFAFSRFVPLSIVSLAVLGAFQVSYYTTTNTLIQVIVPARLRGRVLSLYILTSWGFMPIGNLLAGIIAERFGATVALAGGGLVTLAVVGLVALTQPSLRTLRADGAAGAAAA